MPTYCYRDPQGVLVELQMSVWEKELREKEGKIELPNGELGTRDLLAEHGGVAHCPGNWPVLSDAAGVHPSQAKEAEAHAQRNGVPTKFTEDGQAVFTSNMHRRKYLSLIGLRDNKSYM